MALVGRWLGAVEFAVVLAGCGGSEPGVTPNGRAVEAAQCPIKRTPAGVKAGTCRSPDGARVLTFRNVSGGWACRLYLTRASTGRRVEAYRTRDAWCSELAWATPHLLVFGDDYRVLTLDPTTG